MAYDAQDPLEDYTPQDPSQAPTGSDTEPDVTPIPEDIENPFDIERLALAGVVVVDDVPKDLEPPVEDYPPPVDDPFEGMDVRDYTQDESFPVEEYGSYQEHYPQHAEQLRRTRRPDTQGDTLQDTVQDTIRNCVAATQGRPGAELVDLLTYMLSSTNVMAYLPEEGLKTYQRLAEVLISDYAESPMRVIDLTDVPGIDAASRKTQAELAIIITRLGWDNLPQTPTATWRALVNYVQRMAARNRALELVAAIDNGETDADCMDLFRSLEPPSASKQLVNASYSQTAKDWEEADLAAAAEAPGFRISSGLPTLDFAFTQKDARGRDIEPRGSWGPGELHIFAAPTGHGKSAAARKLITAAAEDLVVGWGREHDKVLIAITEETPTIVYQVAGLGKGQPFHHLAKNVVISAIGASRRRLIHSVWDLVVEAYHRSKDTGMPISNCGLPAFVVMDYVGGVIEDGEGADTTAIEKTANLLMRGIAAWDVQMMEEFSGESFAAYAGMSWPTGMGAFRPSVLGFAQFKKLADPQWYDPTKRGSSVADFVVEDVDGAPGWDVLPGDFRIPTQSEVRGSGVLINHATSLIIGHRSRPQKNPKLIDPDTGQVRLADSRARWLLVKTRNSADFPFIEMRFDSLPSGLRGGYFDLRAEIGVERGFLTPTECYQEAGDPLLPRRPVRTPFDGVAY